MMQDINIWLERLTSLYKSQMRRVASSEKIQLVHLEILQYLSICNKYSNTAQALSEYLGQTKGSISQSLKIMEKTGHILRQPSLEDKRVTQIFLTIEGKHCLERVSVELVPTLDSDEASIEVIKSILKSWQISNRQAGFGQCQSCRYNLKNAEDQFQCQLTGDNLSTQDIKLICREHLFVDNDPSLTS